jgi:copper resistance protein C
MMIRSTLLTLSVLSGLLSAAPAFAHARLSAASPADGSAVSSSPEVVTLTFSEGLEPAFSHLTLTAPSGTVVQLDDETVGGEGSMVLSARPATALPPGRYIVHWQVLSTDGHKTMGSTSFTVSP